MKESFEIQGNVVDIEAEKVFKGKVVVKDGLIAEVIKTEEVPINSKGPFILPGLIDAHIHIEDTLISPCEFARLVFRNGTVAAVCDPHEIGNVMGIPGIEYMIAQSKASPLKFFYGAPSCVPATDYETSGAILGPKEIKELMNRPDIHFLGEFMSFPSVISGEKNAMEKIKAAKDAGKPIDGHAPMVTGEDLDKYIAAGVSTDHECTALAEAREKAKKGMMIIVRDGSAAHDLETLYPIINEMPDKVMLCTDDCHPDDLVYKGHMDYIVRNALELKCKLFNVLRAATINPVKHYKLPVGLLKVGDPADFIVVDSLSKFEIQKTCISGTMVFDKPKVLIPPHKPSIVNNFVIGPITETDIVVPAAGDSINVIGVVDRQLYTQKITAPATINDKNEVISNPSRDVLKLVVVNRYAKAKPAVAFIKGFGIQTGALALSVSHDAHNLVCVGVSDVDITRALNMIIKSKGGVSATANGKDIFLPLPIAGLMSDLDAETTGKKYEELQNFAKSLGSRLSAPFPTLSFMSLTVIPEVKLSDRGLYDVTKFAPMGIFASK